MGFMVFQMIGLNPICLITLSMQGVFQAFIATTIFSFKLSFQAKAIGMKLQLGGWGAYDIFAVFIVSLNNTIYSVVRNTYHSPASCFIFFLLIKKKEISLYSFFKSCNYELSFLPPFTSCKKCLKKTLVRIYKWM